ncbi:MAG TPA: post-COAP-1 domain-containing protein [Solirubrobacterales bacterium]|nr:post-COAP-1 domain-containing protein [Solirubrobacterales bacterium]
MRRLLVLTCLVLGMSSALPAAASASFPWSNQSAMQFEPEAYLRETFIIDTAPGSIISRQLFLSQPYLSFYEGEGFDRNFFTWAPHTSVGDDYMAGRGWTGCASVQVPVAGGPSHCAPGAVKFGAPGSMRADVLEGFLGGFKWGETFISDVCGNWSPANTAPKDSPMPVIEGVKYEDQNADGFREQGEPGLAGWRIYLFYNGKEVASTTTGAGGAYSFRLDADTMPIGAGTYTLKEESREGWHQQKAPKSIFVSFGAGEAHFEGNDFGNWRPATISGHKFDDSNVDGSWGEGERGLPEWGIHLSNGEEVLTGSDGSYSFSVRPGTYTVNELLRSGWRQTAPGAPGTRSYTVTSGQVVEGADFGNVCLGGVAVEPVDDSSGEPFAGLEVSLEEVSVPGILENEPSLPRTATGTADFGELLPGTYRVVAFLPEGAFTSDPDAVLIEGRFAIVKEVTVGECETTDLPLHLFTQSNGKATGGVKIAVPGGFATAGFEFMTRGGVPRGTLQYQDHAAGLNLHAATIEAISVSGDVATIWGKAEFEGARQRFRLRLVDAGEPGREDRFELTLAPGYEAGQGETLTGGNVQVHS